jgi:hypothetical protein
MYVEEDRLKFCILFLPITFLLSNFSHFSQQFRNQCKILGCFEFRFKFCEEKVFRSHKPFLNFKANFARNGSNFLKMCFKKVSYNKFLHRYTREPHHFLKKHRNHCTLHIFVENGTKKAAKVLLEHKHNFLCSRKR